MVLDGAIKVLQKARMIRPMEQEGERGHEAYTRVRRGKMEYIPAKGEKLKEREDIKPEAKDVMKSKEAKEFSQLLDSYFYIQKEMSEMKNLLKQHEDELSSVMGKIRPYLSKMENLEKEENKFRAEFKEGDWSYKFLQFTRESKPYKELYIKAFNMLNDKAQEELKKVEEALKSITAQEKFERKPLEKSLKSMDDNNEKRKKEKGGKTKPEVLKDKNVKEKKDDNGFNELISSIETLVGLREKGLELLKLFFGTVKENKNVKEGKEVKKEEKEKKEIKKSVLIKAIQSDQISEKLADMLLSLIMKARVRPFTRTRRGKLERVAGYERKDTKTPGVWVKDAKDAGWWNNAKVLEGYLKDMQHDYDATDPWADELANDINIVAKRVAQLKAKSTARDLKNDIKKLRN